MRCRCLPHQNANQIVRQQVHINFLPHDIRTLASKHIHLQRGFDIAQAEFRRPAG